MSARRLGPGSGTDGDEIDEVSVTVGVGTGALASGEAEGVLEVGEAEPVLADAAGLMPFQAGCTMTTTARPIATTENVKRMVVHTMRALLTGG